MQMLLTWLVKLSLSSISTPSSLNCEVLVMIWSSVCSASVFLSESMFLGLIVRHWNFSVLASRKLSQYQDTANFPWCFSLEDTKLCSHPVSYSWWSSAYMNRFVSGDRLKRRTLPTLACYLKNRKQRSLNYCLSTGDLSLCFLLTKEPYSCL